MIGILDFKEVPKNIPKDIYISIIEKSFSFREYKDLNPLSERGLALRRIFSSLSDEGKRKADIDWKNPSFAYVTGLDEIAFKMAKKHLSIFQLAHLRGNIYEIVFDDKRMMDFIVENDAWFLLPRDVNFIMDYLCELSETERERIQKRMLSEYFFWYSLKKEINEILFKINLERLKKYSVYLSRLRPEIERLKGMKRVRERILRKENIIKMNKLSISEGTDLVIFFSSFDNFKQAFEFLLSIYRNTNIDLAYVLANEKDVIKNEALLASLIPFIDRSLSKELIKHSSGDTYLLKDIFSQDDINEPREGVDKMVVYRIFHEVLGDLRLDIEIKNLFRDLRKRVSEEELIKLINLNPWIATKYEPDLSDLLLHSVSDHHLYFIGRDINNMSRKFRRLLSEDKYEYFQIPLIIFHPNILDESKVSGVPLYALEKNHSLLKKVNEQFIRKIYKMIDDTMWNIFSKVTYEEVEENLSFSMGKLNKILKLKP